MLEQQVALVHSLAHISVIGKAVLRKERQMTYHEHGCCCDLTFDAGLLFAVSQVDDHNVVTGTSENPASDHQCSPIVHLVVATNPVDKLSMIVVAMMTVTTAPRDRMVRLHDGFFLGRLFVHQVAISNRRRRRWEPR